MRRLVVFRRPALRNGGGPVAIQRLRRRRALLVYLQRAGLLPALPRQRNKGHPRPGIFHFAISPSQSVLIECFSFCFSVVAALGKRSSEAARNAGLHRWRDLRPPILQEHQLGATRAKRYRTAVQTQSRKCLPFWFS